MTESAQNMHQVLLNAKTSSQMFKAMYDQARHSNAKITLGFLCRKAGIKSTGTLSDVMTGRRRLNIKYVGPLLEALGVSGITSEFVTLTLQLEETRSIDETEKLKTRLQSLRKGLTKQVLPMPERIRTIFFAFEVFSAFGLFEHEPTREQLRKYFGASRGVEMEVALNILLAAQLIEKSPKGYRLIHENIKFLDSEDGISHLDFLRLSIRDAENKVEEWYKRRDESCFTSTIISVRESDYRRIIPKLKEQFGLMVTDLENSSADRLIRFNVQVYPLEALRP